MEQICTMYIDIDVKENTIEERELIVLSLKEKFNHKENCNIEGFDAEIEIVDDAKDLIVVDVWIKNEDCYFVAGSPSTRFEPGEPAYIENLLTEKDLKNWAKIQLKDFDYEIDECNVPSEEDMMEEYTREKESSYYYEEY